jgi:DNA-binding response OmpR family regulator
MAAVLVVDAEAEPRGAVVGYLREQGFDTLEAGDGLEALLQVKHGRPRAVVLDVSIPRLGGLDALKRIHAFDPAITVVVVSAERDPELERQARSLGASTVLVKPVSMPGLLAALDPSRRVKTPQAGRVLVVDDDSQIRELLEEYLTDRGYKARGVADGNEGVRAVVEDRPDVVLLDIEIPGLNGIDALAKIRAVAPDVKVIMISGTDSLEVSKRSLAYGAFDYIAKPVDFGYLGRSLETAMMMKRLES